MPSAKKTLFVAIVLAFVAGAVVVGRNVQFGDRAQAVVVSAQSMEGATVSNQAVRTKVPVPPPASGGGAVEPRYPLAGVTKSAWLTPDIVPASSAGEPSGNFRTFCGYSHMSYDDPIVYPGQPGKAHLHQFFGNTEASAASTYASLRSGGSGTCQGGPLNRTGYWVPAMHNSSGQVVVPEQFELYYKGNGSQDEIRSIQTNPNGLRMIAGYDMAAAVQSYELAQWSCGGGSATRTTTIPRCGRGELVKVELRFPMCWNGSTVDSANHRSHMTYGTGGGGWVTRQAACPASHPIHLPELTLMAYYTSDGSSDQWYLNSDRMPGMTHANGETFHADWFGAWDAETQETWTQKCIREMRNCSWGQMGDGTRLVDYRGEYAGPRVVAAPAK